MTEEDYSRTVDLLNLLIEEVRDDVDHPLCSLLEVVGGLVERYETELDAS